MTVAVGLLPCAKEMCPQPLHTAWGVSIGPRDLTCPCVSKLSWGHTSR